MLSRLNKWQSRVFNFQYYNGYVWCKRGFLDQSASESIRIKHWSIPNFVNDCYSKFLEIFCSVAVYEINRRLITIDLHVLAGEELKEL